MQKHGDVLSCKVLRHPTGVSKRVGFVQMSTQEDTQAALAALHGRLVSTLVKKGLQDAMLQFCNVIAVLL